ncbi:MAG: sulfite exporter TauE/SafE family protein, partial [Gammaproteobacteria bacterium]
MNDLQLWQYLCIGLIFVWTGFVRAGLGFGGAALGLPLLLLVVDSPIVFLPLIGVHLLVFTALTVRTSWGQIDWKFLGWALKIMIIPKLLGVFGLLNLPNEWMTLIVYVVALIYGLSYITGRSFTSHSRWVDVLLLVVGAYISGTSLIGAPLIVAVFARHVDRSCLRDT